MSKQPIFTKADYDRLTAKERALHEVLPTIDSAEACGVDCQELRAVHTELLDKLGKVKQHFMSPPPKR